MLDAAIARNPLEAVRLAELLTERRSMRTASLEDAKWLMGRGVGFKAPHTELLDEPIIRELLELRDKYPNLELALVERTRG